MRTPAWLQPEKNSKVQWKALELPVRKWEAEPKPARMRAQAGPAEEEHDDRLRGAWDDPRPGQAVLPAAGQRLARQEEESLAVQWPPAGEPEQQALEERLPLALAWARQEPQESAWARELDRQPCANPRIRVRAR
jgi:hypothetical protein